METLVVNFFAGPGAGKSTTAAGVFSLLKQRGVSTELVTEFAKDLVWEKSQNLMDNQIWIFGVQHHRIWRLLGQVDVIVTDAPLLHSVVYGDPESSLSKLVVEEHNKLNNLNVFLERKKKFVEAGRIHNEEQSKALDDRVFEILDEQDNFYFFPGGEYETITAVADLVQEDIESREIIER